MHPQHVLQDKAPLPHLGPPEAHREADVQCPNIVPVVSREKEHLPGAQDALLKSSCFKPGESPQVRVLHIHLQRQERVSGWWSVGQHCLRYKGIRAQASAPRGLQLQGHRREQRWRGTRSFGVAGVIRSPRLRLRTDPLPTAGWLGCCFEGHPSGHPPGWCCAGGSFRVDTAVPSVGESTGGCTSDPSPAERKQGKPAL